MRERKELPTTVHARGAKALLCVSEVSANPRERQPLASASQLTQKELPTTAHARGAKALLRALGEQENRRRPTRRL